MAGSGRYREVDMVVVSQRRGAGVVRALGFALALVALAGGAWHFGIREGETRHGAAVAELAVATSALAAAEAQVQALEMELSDLRLAERFDGSAQAEVRDAVRDLRGELASAEQELRFYRGLMTPGDAGSGVRIERLDLTATGDPSLLRYKLLLVQVADKHELVQGQVRLNVLGTRDGEPVVLAWDDLAPVEQYPLGFRFRYFQDLPGELRLPAGFSPEQVQVVADAAGSGQLERVFAWQVQEG